ncbi:alpha/beta fold hydrolase [Tessaracoccus rhinocerotis]|uniref:alpha/beta fold hydrolase n=1 Tax=Tessaracoccus rhinocerotis TaxID=1689449 RepID=UPI00163DC3ED|nr:alpha/beta hydrolase [Tessaracoccus rhinocerotis]
MTGLIHGPEDGTPILYIAGAGTGKSMVFGEDLLDTRGIRLITMDRPGMGSSGADPTRTPASTADDYRAFVAVALGVTNPTVPIVANSQGALFGLAAAAQGWAQTLVLASPADEVANPSVRELLPEAARALPDLVQGTPDAARDLLGSFTPHAMRTMVLDGADAKDRAVYTTSAFDALYQTALAEGFAGDGGGYVADTMMATTPWPVDLAAITTPVTVLFGARDRVHSPDHGALLTTRIPHARRVVVSEAGGALLWTHSGLVFDMALQLPGSPPETL